MNLKRWLLIGAVFFGIVFLANTWHRSKLETELQVFKLKASNAIPGFDTYAKAFFDGLTFGAFAKEGIFTEAYRFKRQYEGLQTEAIRLDASYRRSEIVKSWSLGLLLICSAATIITHFRKPTRLNSLMQRC